METPDSNRLRRIKTAIMSFQKQFALKPFLRAVWTTTMARAHWLAMGLLLVGGIFSFWTTSALTETLASQKQLRMLLNELQGTYSLISDAETGQRGYLLTGDETYLEPYLAAVRNANPQIDRLENLVTAVPEQRSTFEAIQRLVAMKFAVLEKAIQLRQSKGIDAAMEVVRTDLGKKIMNEIRGQIDEIEQATQERLETNDRQTIALSMRVTERNTFGNVLAAFLFFLVIRGAFRERKRIEERARELAHFAEASRIRVIEQSESEIESIGQQARDLAVFAQTLQERTPTTSDKEIDALAQQARDLARSVETARRQALQQSDGKIEVLGQQARELARSVEMSRIQSRKLNEDLNQRILERTAQLEAANKELESFSYSVSHDLRAPLRAIDGFSRIVLEDYSGPMAAEGKAYLQMVRDNTRQMGQLVDDLLAFARLSRQALNKYPIDPDFIVRRCLEEMAQEQEGRHVEIVIGDLCSCDADPALLKQIWTNLLSNALKYTRKRETARIEVGCRTEPRSTANGQQTSPASAESDVVYFVKDNGAGFDMKYVLKLFGVFQRLHRAADYEGTGVGLAIVQRIVHRHGGRVWAEAMPNQGATFSFTLK